MRKDTGREPIGPTQAQIRTRTALPFNGEQFSMHTFILEIKRKIVAVQVIKLSEM